MKSIYVSLSFEIHALKNGKWTNIYRKISISNIKYGGIETFLPPGLLEHFRLGGVATFWAKNITQEKLLKFAKILKYINSSCITFSAKLF